MTQISSFKEGEGNPYDKGNNALRIRPRDARVLDFGAHTLSAGQSLTLDPVPLLGGEREGTLLALVTGAGLVEVSQLPGLEVTVGVVLYALPLEDTALLAGRSTGGPGGDGRLLAPVRLPICTHLQIRLAEVSEVASVTAHLYLALA